MRFAQVSKDGLLSVEDSPFMKFRGPCMAGAMLIAVGYKFIGVIDGVYEFVKISI